METASRRPTPSKPEVVDETLHRFGLSTFRPGQREVIESVLSGRPTIVVLPTGAGKSLCYQLPALALGGLTVVVSPLISLMKDQVDALTARGIAATFINSSIPPVERHKRLTAALRGDIRLLYVAPERFSVPAFCEAIERARPVLFAIDEAHCVTEWGTDFRPDYARLGDVLDRIRPPRVVALTATATPDVREKLRKQLGLVKPAVFVRGFDRTNLQFEVMPVQNDRDKLAHCLALLKRPPVRGAPAIVYAATRKKVEEVALALCDARIPARAYHAGLDDAERVEVQDLWMANRIHVVVATNAFGMGVDKRDVRLVVHHALPGSVEAYYQEVGRAGRDNLPARCVLLFNHADVRLREYLIQLPSTDGRQKPKLVVDAAQARLQAMTAYAYARTCRRELLLRHFGDEPCACSDGSAACDSCATAGIVSRSSGTIARAPMLANNVRPASIVRRA